jgi:hypothetical protein
VIRRGFWLVVGAAGGIMGYRRVSSLGRQVSQTLGARPKTAGANGAAVRKRHLARETLRFTRDVRQGMDLYIDRQQARSAPTLGAGAHALDHTDHGKHDEREDH